jgi:hypothetical protein
VKPQATAAGCHFGEILPQGATLMDGTVSQLFEELAGEMNRPSDRKRRISGYGDRTWRRKADGELGFAAPIMSERQQPDRGPARLPLPITGQQRFEGAPVGMVREELFAID